MQLKKTYIYYCPSLKIGQFKKNVYNEIHIAKLALILGQLNRKLFKDSATEKIMEKSLAYSLIFRWNCKYSTIKALLL